MPGGKTLRKIGSRRQVMNGTAEKTVGGLRAEDLTYNKYRRIVSRKRQDHGIKKFGGSKMDPVEGEEE